VMGNKARSSGVIDLNFLAQRRKGAKKKFPKPEVFLCAFAPLREKSSYGAYGLP